MKKLFNIVLTAILAICFVSCDEEQSSFDVNTVPFTAKIKGKVTANVGEIYSITTGTIGIQTSNVNQKRIFIEIENKSLDPNGRANGYTIYETVTDSDGNYSFEIPTVYNGANVIVRAEDYEGTYQLLQKDATGNPIFTTNPFTGAVNASYTTQNVVYTTAPENKTLKPNDIQICNLEYNKR